MCRHALSPTHAAATAGIHPLAAATAAANMPRARRCLLRGLGLFLALLCAPARVAGACVTNTNRQYWPRYTTFVNLDQTSGVAKACGDVANMPCASCGLYRTYSAPAAAQNARFAYSGSAGKPWLQPDVSQNDHVLVMPAAPCRGVEEWRTDACRREAIW